MPPSTARSNDPRFYDFDAAFAEQKTIPFKLLGKVWELPGTVPAATILRVQRLMLLASTLEEGDDLPDDFVIDDDLSVEKMCRELAGSDIVDKWLELGISFDMLTAVSRRLFAIHTGQAVDEGKAPAKTKPAAKSRTTKRSSSTGR